MANRVHGLRPTNDRPSVGGRLKGRVQAPDAGDMRPEALRPAAAPVDTYFRPEQADRSNPAMELAASLAAFQPSLMGFLQTQSKEEDSADRARMILQTTPRAEVEAGIKEGKYPEFQTLKGMEVYGEEAAYGVGVELERRWNEDFDKDGGDVDALIKEVVGPLYQSYGKDKGFLSRFAPTTEKIIQRFRAGVGEHRSKRVMEDRGDMVYNTWAGRLDFETAEGAAPAEVAASLYGDFQENRDFLRLPYKEQQAYALQLATQQATKGNYDVAEALLRHERGDGPYKGSLLTDKDLGKGASALLATIEKDRLDMRLKAQSEEAEGQLDATLVNAVKDGTITGLTDAQVPGPNGELKTYTPEQLQKRAAKLAIEDSQKRAAYAKETPEQSYAREVREFVGSGLKHEPWFTVMEAGASTASMNSLTGGKIPPALEDGYGKYKQLYSDAPQYVAKHIDKKALDFYEAVRTAEEDLGMDRQEAFLTAHRVTRNPNENDTLTNQKYQDIDAAVDRVVGSSGFSWSWGGVVTTEAGNASDAKSELVKYAKLYARMGNSTTRAMELAEERFNKNFININGSFVRQDPRLPVDFQPLVEQTLQEFVEKYGEKEGIEFSDVAIVANNGTGTYQIVDKTDFSPFGYPEGVITLRSLTALRDRIRKTELDRVKGVVNTR